MNPLNLKVILVGSENVGKTTLLHRFTDNEFSRNTPSTVSAAFRCKLCQYKQYRVTLGIWDTVGQSKRTDSTVFYKRAKVAILCYDITNAKTFEALDRYIELVRKEAEPNCLFAIIGTKSDLADRTHRQITTDRAKKFAKDIGASFALETSSANGFQVNDVFHRVISTYVDTFILGQYTNSPTSPVPPPTSYLNQQEIPQGLLEKKEPSFDNDLKDSNSSFNSQDTSFNDSQNSNYKPLIDNEISTPNNNKKRDNDMHTIVCTCRFPCLIL